MNPVWWVVCVLVGALVGGVLGGWIAMAIGLVALPLIVLAARGTCRQLSH